MHLGPPLASLLLVGLLGTGLMAPAQAAEPTPTTLTLSGSRAHAGADSRLAVDLRQDDGTPVAAAEVLLERRTAEAWAPLGMVTTDEAGHAELDATLRRQRRLNVFRATYPGDGLHAEAASGAVQVRLLRRNSRVRIGGPDTVVDETSVPIRVRWVAGNGEPVAGRVRVLRRLPGGEWRRVRTVRTDADGRAEFLARPRTDSRWKAKARRLAWVSGDRSGVHRVDNLPPGEPVRLPSAAPRPRIGLPRQPHAVGAGPHAVITRIPDGVWAHMTGISWHRGCPVGRAGLRYLRINYWDYQGYRRRGELVANRDAVGQMAAALADMYHRRLPIRAMYRVDRFGYSGRVRGGDDFASMAAGNTSGFNCRDVVNRPGVRSPHSYGRSIDLNTWENPYRSARGIVPNRWWQFHSHPRVAWRSRSHPVVRIMTSHGLRWTYGLGDTQHFDAADRHGRVLVRPDCVCD